jgi:DNA helicase HerA-like ATPase
MTIHKPPARTIAARPPRVGQVLGTQDATPLGFWVAVNRDAYLQLDDVVLVRTSLPDSTAIHLYGVVDLVRARHEGTQFDSDVFLVTAGLLPAETSIAAHIAVTRVEPEIFVPPRPGEDVFLAIEERDIALFFDGMRRRLPLGTGRDDLPVYGNLDFLDGTRGAHVNISGVSGVATKTTYATFLLYNLFHSGALHTANNSRALIFNVKGEDLLFLDRENAGLDDGARDLYARLGLRAGPFKSVRTCAPVRRGAASALPDTGSRLAGVTAFFWTLREFARERYLRFLFADADAESEHLASVIERVETQLRRAVVDMDHDAHADPDDPTITIGGRRIGSFEALVETLRIICEGHGEDEDDDDGGGDGKGGHNGDPPRVRLAVRRYDWVGSAATGTLSAFVRRLEAAAARVGHLIRGDGVERADEHRIDILRDQVTVTVIDLHNLHERAQRFVVGVVLKRMFEDKESRGAREPLVFVVLDELNKYAPREGWSPIKEILLDIAERGRSLGIILIGAQQTASEVERRVVANCAFRVVGRLDAAEAAREEYGFLPAATRQRAAILKPGTMIVQQPEIPIPLLIRFPFPAWATRPEEVGGRAEAEATEDLFERLES